MSKIRILSVTGLVAGLALTLGTGCPKGRPTLGRVSDNTLASDAQKLGPRLREAKVPAATRLLQAYLAHCQGAEIGS